MLQRLYEIVDWNDPSQGFTIRFPEAGFVFTEQYHQWVDYSVQLSVGAKYSQVLGQELKTNALVCDSTGAPLPEVADCQALHASIAEKALTAYIEKPESQKVEKNGPKVKAAIHLTPADRVFIESRPHSDRERFGPLGDFDWSQLTTGRPSRYSDDLARIRRSSAASLLPSRMAILWELLSVTSLECAS